MSDYTNYANFNALTFTGRVLATKLLSGKDGEYMAVTMITFHEFNGWLKEVA